MRVLKLVLFSCSCRKQNHRRVQNISGLAESAMTGSALLQFWIVLPLVQPSDVICFVISNLVDNDRSSEKSMAIQKFTTMVCGIPNQAFQNTKGNKQTPFSAALVLIVWLVQMFRTRTDAISNPFTIAAGGTDTAQNWAMERNYEHNSHLPAVYVAFPLAI